MAYQACAGSLESRIRDPQVRESVCSCIVEKEGQAWKESHFPWFYQKPKPPAETNRDSGIIEDHFGPPPSPRKVCFDKFYKEYQMHTCSAKLQPEYESGPDNIKPFRTITEACRCQYFQELQFYDENGTMDGAEQEADYRCFRREKVWEGFNETCMSQTFSGNPKFLKLRENPKAYCHCVANYYELAFKDAYNSENPVDLQKAALIDDQCMDRKWVGKSNAQNRGKLYR